VTKPSAKRHVCPRCSQSIERAQLVVFDSGELFHVECYEKTGGAIDVVAEHLRSRPRKPFCHTCLSAALGMPYEAIHKAVTALRLQREFLVLVGKQCALCQEQRVTVQAGE
jgi:hypothetical protein